MLTLLEPPGAKQHQRFQSGQYLLNVGGGAAAGADEEDYDDDDLDALQHTSRGADGASTGCCAPLEKVLDRRLVGKSSSNEYSARWKREFRQRPSWCDADLCLQQIKRRKAKGNRWALYSRSFIQKALHSLGSFVQEHAWSVIVTMLVLFSLCCYGLQYVRIETDIVKLWVAKGGRLDEELSFHKSVLESVTYNHSRDDAAAEVVRENGLGGGYQVVIQTPSHEDENMLTREGLLKHVSIMEEIANISVNKLGIDWRLSDLCFKPAKPDTSDPMARKFEGTIDKIIPCIWITPIDCFWEGSKPLGPAPAVSKKKDLSPLALVGILDHIDGDEVSWKNLNPTEIIHGINNLFSLGTYALMFDRAGIGKGYLDRPCIEPLDPECPRDAPNYFETCKSGLVDRWVELMERRGEKIELKEIDEFSVFDMDFGSLFNRKKRQAESLAKAAERDELADPQHNSTRLESVEVPVAPVQTLEEATTTNTTTTTTTTTTTQTPPTPTTMTPAKRKEYCTARHGPMLQWMAKPENRLLWKELLGENPGPQYPDFPKVMSEGCGGFARGVLQWPSDMILGAAKRNASTGALDAASALQSVFLVASPNDVYLRFKTSASLLAKPTLATANWTTTAAEDVIVSWQRAFTQLLYKHKHNFETDTNGVEKERRTIHPLASTSIADMLEEFCQFNYTIILVGYGLMLVYAMVTQLRTERCLPAAHSCMGLALAGVVTVTFASVAGLGMATWFGIEFNAATTQIVPFLTLGIGVDNMFMLLHNYHDVVAMSSRNEMGVLLRETGMSILCTSTNNILSFLAGTLLPIPALRSFCAQSTILLTFNFIAILTIYPAVISIDLRRRKAGRRDLLCCLPDPVEENYRQSKQNQPGRKPMNGETSYRNLISKTGHHKEIEEVDDASHGHHGFLEEVVPYTLHAAIRNYYIPFISNTCVKVTVILASIALCVVAVMGMRQASIGLELSDVLPEHTAPAAFLKARDQYFSFYPMFAVLKGPHIDYPNQQQLIENYRNAIGASKYVIKNAKGAPSEAYWLGMMRDWLRSIQNETDQAITKGQIDVKAGLLLEHAGKPNISDAALTGYKLLCSHGQKYDCARVGKVRLVDETGMINPDGFYNYLTAWFNQDNMMYYVTQASFFPNPPAWAVNATGLVPPAEPLAYTQIPFYLTGLTNTPVIVEVIKEIRSICDDFSARGLPNFPQGIAFTFWEQYLHLNGNLMQAIATIALAVFVVLSVLLFNPWAAGSILAILVCMTIQLAGFLGWAGIKMNPVSAVTLITAVGIGVEFTAHVVLAFLTSLGNRQERMAAAVDRVFVPVIHGALSTLLGILMLAFSEFEFVVKYFFVVMSALIVIGLINGLILLPVLLSLVGPPTEITPLDNKRCLQLPPPVRKSELDDYEDGPMCYQLEDLTGGAAGDRVDRVPSVVAIKGLTMYARQL